MGTFGDAVHDIFATIVTDTGLFAEAITLTRNAITEGSYGGYSGGTVTGTTTSYSATVIPDTLKARDSFQIYGDLKQGEIVVFFDAAVTVGLKDTITYASEVYDINDIQEYRTNGTSIVKALSCSRRFTNDNP